MKDNSIYKIDISDGIITYNVCKLGYSPISEGIFPVIRAFLKYLWSKKKKKKIEYLVVNTIRLNVKLDQKQKRYIYCVRSMLTYKSVKFFMLPMKSREELTLYKSLICLDDYSQT